MGEGLSQLMTIKKKILPSQDYLGIGLSKLVELVSIGIGTGTKIGIGTPKSKLELVPIPWEPLFST